MDKLAVGGGVKVYFLESHTFWTAIVLEVDLDDNTARLRFEKDGYEGWYQFDEKHAREVLDDEKLGRKQAWQLASADVADSASSSATAPPLKRKIAAAPAAAAASKKPSMAESRKPAASSRAAGKRRLEAPEDSQSEEEEEPVKAEVKKAPPVVKAGREMRGRKPIDYRKTEEMYDDDSMGASSGSDEEAPRSRLVRQGKKKAAAVAADADADDDAWSSDEDEDDDYAEDEDDSEDGRSKRKKKAAQKPEKQERQTLTKKEKEEEAKEWLAIQENPPPPMLKTPPERPGYSWQRELRSRRGHLPSFSKPDKNGKSKKIHNQNYQPPYLDSPFDVTDRGVAHIVTDQAKRLTPLLLTALKKKQLPKIELQTLCSGTDAPAIALSLVCKELRPSLQAKAGAALDVTHSMSCESEPFKQAYIARNFPHVVLFSDVVELAEGAQAAVGTSRPGSATTSFGGVRVIPKPPKASLSLLVAGTSCKDFSARKRATGVRKDIEDMGTSGETFIAAVDFLFAQQHDLVLLENVNGAPWEKMAGYITGRVGLKAAFAKFKSAQKGGEKKADDDDEAAGAKGETLETTLEREGGQLVVVSVAPLHGVRLGAVLRGYLCRAADGEVALDMKSIGLKVGASIELGALCKKLKLPTNDERSILLFDMPAKYHAKIIKVDTKLYGLPHTRNRGYMLAWKDGTYGKLTTSQVGDAWEELVKGLQTGLDHAVEAFLLPDSSDRIRRFRDVLRSPIAQRLAKDQEGGDYYSTNKDADTRYNIGYRNCVHLLTNMDRQRKSVQDCQKAGANMDVFARPLTRWGPGTPPKLLSNMWMQDVVAFWSQHSLDHIDVKAVKNAESGVDMLHHNVLLDLSQNVHMTDLLNRAGVTSCLTPGGQMFHLTRGREISGYEKLLLSGIPADSLLLGGESEVQLSDLAGNAMSMPVVSACMLAAFCIQPYVEAKGDGKQDTLMDRKVDDPVTGKKNAKQTYKAVLPLPTSGDAERTSGCGAVACADVEGAKLEPFQFDKCVVDLASRAERCSVLCTCESSGDVSIYAVDRCETCLLTTCRLCAAKIQLETHSMVPLHASQSERFHDSADPAAAPEEFEKELRRSVPDAIRFATALSGNDGGSGGDGSGVGTDLFRLTRVERGRGLFTLRYVAYERAGTAAAVLYVSLGRLEEHGSLGLKGVLFDLSTGQRGPLPPAARLLVRVGEAAGSKGTSAAAWEVCEPKDTTLHFEAVEGATSKSFRSEIGLIDFGEEVWPSKLRVRGQDAGCSVAGTYVRQRSRGVMAFGALWKREAEEGRQAASAGMTARRGMWLFVDPDVDRTGPDRLVFATTPTYRDGRAHHVAELLLAEEEPVLEWLHELGQRALHGANGAAAPAKGAKGASSKAASSKAAIKKPKVSGDGGGAISVSARLLQWNRKPEIQLLRPKGGPVVTQQLAAAAPAPASASARGGKGKHAASEAGGGGGGGGDEFPSFVVRALPAATLAKLKAQAKDGTLSVLASSSTVAERRLAESLAAPLLRFGFETARGVAQRPSGALAWGECEKSAPRRPPEVWGEDGRRAYDTEHSNAYEQAMSERPSAWEVRMAGEGAEGGKGASAAAGAAQVVVRPQVEVAAHQAAEKLLRGRGIDEVARASLCIDWQVGPRLDSTRVPPSFPIPSSKDDAKTAQPPKAVWDAALTLYPRQLAVKGWMEAIEEGAITYEERDCTDASLPGVGWQLEAKATMTTPLRGGVLADALGAGKTVTVIALIAADAAAARRLDLKGSSASGSKHLSRASLIVVTPLIIRQWEMEIKRFTGGKLKCVRIESAAHLQDVTYKELREADIVLMVSDLLGCAGKAVKYAKAVDVDPENQTSQEAFKDAKRAAERIEDQKMDKHEAMKLAKSLDDRKDTYLDVLTECAGTEELPPFLHRRNQNRESGIGDSETTIYGVWVSRSSRDPYGKVKGRQEDREAAAYFSHSYARVALPALRAKTFNDADKGVPIEYFRWRRVIVDECHEPLCMGADDVDESAMSSKRSSCAVRELLGIALPDPASRPLLAQRGTFGLTGTPLLSSVARITELASLCAGTYVTGGSHHWRTVERASARDLFLRYHDSVASRLYQSQTVRSARDFVNAAARRNVVDEEIGCVTREWPVRLEANSRFERRIEELARQKDARVAGLCPESDAIGEASWLELAQMAAEAKERRHALVESIRVIHADEPLAKVLVFAPHKGFQAAAEAVKALAGPTFKVQVITPGERQEQAAELVLAFDEPPLQATYKAKCRVMLLAYEDGAGLNLQHGCHHVVLYAPLAGSGHDQEAIIGAVGKEQQSIGRVRRFGQKSLVTVHRIVLQGPNGQETLDGVITKRNQHDDFIRCATNVGEA